MCIRSVPTTATCLRNTLRWPSKLRKFQFHIIRHWELGVIFLCILKKFIKWERYRSKSAILNILFLQATYICLLPSWVMTFFLFMYYNTIYRYIFHHITKKTQDFGSLIIKELREDSDVSTIILKWIKIILTSFYVW